MKVQVPVVPVRSFSLSSVIGLTSVIALVGVYRVIDFLNSLPEWLKTAFGILIGLGVPIGIIVTGLIEYLSSGRKARLKVLCIVLAILLTGVLSFAHFQAHDAWGAVVYTTNTGDCYHMSSCKYLHSRHATTIAQAWEDGFVQCSVCNPNFWAVANPVIPRAGVSYLVCLWLYMLLDWKTSSPKEKRKGE